MATTELIDLAIETSQNAYVPYSHFPIGAVWLPRTGVSIQDAILKMLATPWPTVKFEEQYFFKAVSEQREFLNWLFKESLFP